MKSILALTIALATTSVGIASPLSDWFAKAPGERGPIPAECLKTPLHSPTALKQAQKSVWNAYKEAALQQGWDQALPEKPGEMKSWMKDGKLVPKVADLGDKTMPYVVLSKGNKPKSGWPMFICLHGGGANRAASGPHSWPVNDREWQAQMQLTTKVWDAPGLYVIPRMADDREGRWYYGYNQVFFDRIIQQAILFNEVDPNRIFLMGISEGGYTAFRLGSMMADRWAGSCAMAAAEPIGNAPPENLRHVAFRCGIGEKDTMFNRHQLARDYFKRLRELETQHPGEYINFHDEQKGRGHGIDYQPGPKWLSKYTRNPVPKTITWTVIKQHDRHRNRLYWLSLDNYQGELPLQLTAEAKSNNTIKITAHTEQDGQLIKAEGINLRVYLNSSLGQLSQEITITVNGKEAFKGKVKPSMEALIQSTAERGDPEQVFPVVIKVSS